MADTPIPDDILRRRFARGLDPLTGQPLFTPDRPKAKAITMGLMKPCCANPANLTVWEQAPGNARETVRKCRVCLCRHFNLRVEPGSVFTAGTPLGEGKDIR